MRKCLARKPSSMSEIAAAANSQKAICIWCVAIAQTTTGTSRKRVMVMAFGRFTRFTGPTVSDTYKASDAACQVTEIPIVLAILAGGLYSYGLNITVETSCVQSVPAK